MKSIKLPYNEPIAESKSAQYNVICASAGAQNEQFDTLEDFEW